MKKFLLTALSNFCKIPNSPYGTATRTIYSSIKPLKQEVALQDLSPLTDTFGRQHTYLRISLTERCNLRCQYCMPAEGVTLTQKSHLLTTDEMLDLAQLFVQQGINKIRLTGGEPTVHKEIINIVQSLKSLDGLENVAITTNGLTLSRQLVNLQRAGLDQLNISLDTLKPDRYEQVTRRKGWQRVIAGIDLAIQLGYSPVKVNVVLMRGLNDDEVLDFVEFTKDRAVDIRFIEYMPFSGNRWHTDKMIPFAQLVSSIKEKYPSFTPLENKPNDTSKAYQVPGFKGQIGFITSMTEHFCGSCNRLRLMADGSLKVCLFGNAEVSLRDALRSGCSREDLITMIGVAVKRKKKQHADFKGTHFGGGIWKGNLALNKTMGGPVSEYPKRVMMRQYSTWKGNYRAGKRHMSGDGKTLTHVSGDGKAVMVDVGKKDISERTAVARGSVWVGPQAAKLIQENSMKKGDVLGVARISGIMGAKRTSRLIPLCHDIALSQVTVDVELKDETVEITAMARCSGQTGVEMEALTAVSIAALTVYDMCKAVNRSIIIQDIRLIKKTGGASGDYINQVNN